MLRTKKVTTRHPNGRSGALQWLVAIVASLAMVLAFTVPANAVPLVRAGGDVVNNVVTLPVIQVTCSPDGSAQFQVSSPGVPGDPYGFRRVLWNNGAPSGVIDLMWGITLDGVRAGYIFPPDLPSYWSVLGYDVDGEYAIRYYFDCADPSATPPPSAIVFTSDPPSFVFGGSSNGTPPPDKTSLPDNVSRIAGANRYATAAKIATQFGTANAVVIANGTDAKQGVDALSANYLAGRVNSPILLTQATRTDSTTLGAVKSVLKGASSPTIYVMGGIDSVSNGVVAQFKAAAASVSTGSIAVRRIAGSDRYATSALAATTPGAVNNSLSLGGDVIGKTAILASGEANADALAAGPLSYGWGIPVLLTPANMAEQVTFDAIKKLGITQLIVLGGTDRVSQTVISHLQPAGVLSVKRIAGMDRYATAADLYNFALDTLRNSSGDHYGVNGDTVYIANGTTGFPDALAAGPLVGKDGNVLLTTAPTKLGASALSFLKVHSQFTSVVGLGSATTVSNSVLSTAGKAVG
jgi:putative cell wall-binding protein